MVARLQTSAPSFASAANANTKANQPGEYATFAQRTAYYDLISLVIEFEPTTAAAVRPVRFFHATTMVTLRSMLGFPTLFANSGTEALAKALGVCFAGAAVTKELIERVNVRLFETNMPVINNLLFKWKQPQHPTSGANAPIDTYAFDLAMVELEQSTVERELAAAKPSKAAIDEVNKLFACDTAGGITGYLTGTLFALGTAKKWADSARSAPFDFSAFCILGWDPDQAGPVAPAWPGLKAGRKVLQQTTSRWLEFWFGPVQIGSHALYGEARWTQCPPSSGSAGWRAIFFSVALPIASAFRKNKRRGDVAS